MIDRAQALQDVIKLAITGEMDSHALYSNAITMVNTRLARTVLEELAEEELGHRAKLEGLLRTGVPWRITDGQFQKVTDLKLGDHLVAGGLTENADLQSVLIVAVQREKQSHELYTTMAGVAGDQAVQNMFEYLANEELTHKRKVESLYEDVVYKDF